MDELSDAERATLDFERLAFPVAGAKEQAIRVRIDIGATTYYQRLNAVPEREATARGSGAENKACGLTANMTACYSMGSLPLQAGTDQSARTHPARGASPAGHNQRAG
jgi:hypothetical protein